MVDLLHQAGLEVILDVVYNHTAEGGWGDRVLSWRGLDNLTYYRTQPHAPQHYDDVTGTGNTLDFGHPRVTQMALDSLRYWVTEMGVDGFRFDLAATLGRNSSGFSADHPFLVGLITDPVLGGVKLIAEPWDVGLGGWQVGNFPQPFSSVPPKVFTSRALPSFRIFCLRHSGALMHTLFSHPISSETAILSTLPLLLFCNGIIPA